MIVNLLRKILPFNIKPVIKKLVVNRLYAYRFKVSFVKKVQNLRSNYTKLVFIIATPCHSNLGDHAIVYAEWKLLKDIGLAERVIEISNIDYINSKKLIEQYILIDDILIIDGGGNMGTLWPMEDDKITEIIDTYSNNIIILFPQTCFYMSGLQAENRLKRNREIYQHAKKLTITLRDQASYEFCVNNFAGVHSIRIPDIVLYINDLEIKKKNHRDGVLLCFRNDLEKVILDVEIMRITDCLRQQGIMYKKTSTLAHNPVSNKQRNNKLLNKWSEFSSAKLVITDRLHGMIFAIITGTPCLAIDNLSCKVSGVYHLIPEVGNVLICKNIDEVLRNIGAYYCMESFSRIDSAICEEYQSLKNILINSIDG